MEIEFISYTGKYPSLCVGVLTVKLDGEVYKFGHESDSYDFRTCKYKDDNFSEFWTSGGRIYGDDFGCFLHPAQGAWQIDDGEHKDYPEFIKSKLPELIELFNAHVPAGCCGGCI